MQETKIRAGFEPGEADFSGIGGFPVQDGRKKPGQRERRNTCSRKKSSPKNKRKNEDMEDVMDNYFLFILSSDIFTNDSTAT